jgi:hypothetical protein
MAANGLADPRIAVASHRGGIRLQRLRIFRVTQQFSLKGARSGGRSFVVAIAGLQLSKRARGFQQKESAQLRKGL